jgi:hypothetical protein
MGGSLKAEGLGDGGWGGAFNHPQASLEAATRTADALGRHFAVQVAIGDGASAPRLSSGLISSNYIAGLLIVVAAVTSVLILVRRRR